MPRRTSRRYTVRSQIDVDAPCERLYRLATDPEVIPRFSREIASMVMLDPPGPTRRARCRIRVAGLPVPACYRYRYSPPRAYAGIQTGSPLARSFFAFSFRPIPRGGTRITHVEGFTARLPFLAWIMGVAYFHILNRGGIRSELLLLKALAEAAPAAL